MHTKTSRESARQTAEAAQVAAPQAAADHAEFRVVLRGVKLDPALEKALCQELRITIIQELSLLGYGGELHATAFGEQPRSRPLVSKSSRLLGMVITSTAES
ncbi:MAG TPA: hypothetical protein VNA24_18495 [Hyalangium sp.]|jgi:hypothetical protein|nr:hypothetical protein [Hyalangium sp.]